MRTLRKFYQRYAGWWTKYKTYKYFEKTLLNALELDKTKYRIKWKNLWEDDGK